MSRFKSPPPPDPDIWPLEAAAYHAAEVALDNLEAAGLSFGDPWLSWKNIDSPSSRTTVFGAPVIGCLHLVLRIVVVQTQVSHNEWETKSRFTTTIEPNEAQAAQILRILTTPQGTETSK